MTTKQLEIERKFLLFSIPKRISMCCKSILIEQGYPDDKSWRIRSSIIIDEEIRFQ